MISIPYNALIIAHEKMDAFAFISILQVILNCSAAYCLSFISNERLLMYGIMMAGISILIKNHLSIILPFPFQRNTLSLENRSRTIKIN